MYIYIYIYTYIYIYIIIAVKSFRFHSDSQVCKLRGALSIRMNIGISTVAVQNELAACSTVAAIRSSDSLF